MGETRGRFGRARRLALTWRRRDGSAERRRPCAPGRCRVTSRGPSAGIRDRPATPVYASLDSSPSARRPCASSPRALPRRRFQTRAANWRRRRGRTPASRRARPSPCRPRSGGEGCRRDSCEVDRTPASGPQLGLGPVADRCRAWCDDATSPVQGRTGPRAGRRGPVRRQRRPRRGRESHDRERVVGALSGAVANLLREPCTRARPAAQAVRGPSKMRSVPARQTAAPPTSQRSGRCPSANHSHRIEDAT